MQRRRMETVVIYLYYNLLNESAVCAKGVECIGESKRECAVLCVCYEVHVYPSS